MIYPNGTESQAWGFDANYNLVARTTVNGSTQLFSYDSRNRQISMTWSNGADWATFGYDAVGRMTNALNRSSAITRIYDDAGRMTHDQQRLQFMPVTAVSRKTHGSAGTFDITLPLIGTPGVECRSGQPTPDQHQIVATFPRNVVSVGNASVTSGTGSVSSTTFSGNQVTIYLSGISNAQTLIVTLTGVSDGTTSSNVNIGMGVLLGDVTGDGTVDGNDVSLVQQQGRAPVSASNFRSDVNVTGGIDGNDVSLTQSETRTSTPLAQIVQPVPAGPVLDVQYGYDDSNKENALSVTSPNGVTTNYNYTFGYDPIGRFNAISSTSGQLFGYQYDAASNETHRTGTNLANGIDQVYTIDPAVNRVDERDLGLNGTAISSEVYSYDDANGRPGLLTSVAHYEQRLSPQWSEDTFGYDLLPELTSAQYNWQQQSGPDTSPPDPGPGFGTGPSTLGGGNTGGLPGGLIVPQLPDSSTWVNPQRSVSYTWDKAGNRIAMTDGNTSYNYATTNLNQYWTDGTSNGNITPGTEHELANYRDVDYAYINDTHLSSISGRAPTYPTAPVYQLNYDALGRCVVRTFNSTINYYFYDGEKPILEYNPGYILLATNLYGKGIDEILMRTTYGPLPGDADSSEDTTDGTDGTYTGDGTDGTAGTARSWYYQDDHEGSITQLTDVKGTIVEWYRYDAFGAPAIFNQGNVQINASNFANRFLFTGREYMATFGVYEYRNRAYHPGLGRFMSEDPKGFDAGDNNFFRYVGNDPMDRTDPMGLTDPDIADRDAQNSYDTGQSPGGAGQAQNPQQQQQQQKDAKQVEKDNRTFEEKLSDWVKQMEVSIFAHPGIVESRKNVQADQVRDAVIDGLNRLGDCKGDCGSNIRVGDEQFAKVADRDEIDTSKWREEWASHPVGKTALESPSIPGHPNFDVKLYQKDQPHNNQIAVVHPTETWTHRAEFGGYLLGLRINARNAETYLREQPVQ